MSSVTGRVLRSQSGQYWVETADGVVHCSLRGRLKRSRKARSDLAVIGDRVSITLLPKDAAEGVIEAVEPRLNRFARRQPGGRGRYKEDVLVANLDVVFLVFATSTPPMNRRLLDRFLVVAELDNIDVVIVANKLDERADDEALDPFRSYETIGYRVLYTSAETGEGIEAVRELASNGISAFLGPSGVGKSSLLNQLRPGLDKAVADVSAHLNKGKHTTRVAELHELAPGAWVADTPGIRELASFALPTTELADCFPEMRPHLGSCRFGGCQHDHEPGCAVKAEVGDSISEARYESYLLIRAGEDSRA